MANYGHEESIARKEIEVRPLSVPEPWIAGLLPRGFPLETKARGKLFAFVSGIAQSIRETRPASRATWLQMHAFPIDGSISRLLSANGRQWMPESGLGVWPDREPPRLWTPADFTDRNFGDSLPELMYVVYYISGQNAAAHAWESTFGSGASAHLVLNKTPEQFHLDLNHELSARIQEEAFKNQPFYFPLLDARSLERARAGDLDRWLQGVLLYIRESVEDRGILVLAREPHASPLFRDL